MRKAIALLILVLVTIFIVYLVRLTFKSPITRPKITTSSVTTPTPATRAPRRQLSISPLPTQPQITRTYRNKEFGFSFTYTTSEGDQTEDPLEVKINVSQPGAIESGLHLHLFPDVSKFSWFLNDGAFSQPLKYNPQKNQWETSQSPNATPEDLICPTVFLTQFQQLSYYHIGDVRSGRTQDFAYVTKQGIIVLRDGGYPFDVSDLNFDRPTDVIRTKSDCQVI